MNDEFWPVGDRFDDPDSLGEVVLEFRTDPTYEIVLKVLQIVMTQLVRMRDHRPYVRLGWGARRLTVIALRGDTGELPRRQLLGARLANELHDDLSGFIVRDSWAAPTAPARSYLRVAHVRQTFEDRGPQPDYLRPESEVVTMLLEGKDASLWSADDETLRAHLAERLKARAEQFRIVRWAAPPDASVPAEAATRAGCPPT